MLDDKSKSRPQDAKRINIHEDYELRDWSKTFGVAKEGLKTRHEAGGHVSGGCREAPGEQDALTEMITYDSAYAPISNGAPGCKLMMLRGPKGRRSKRRRRLLFGP
jgi:hypothetical protein